MSVVPHGVDHGVDRLLNVVKGYGIRILRLTQPLNTPSNPVLVRLWRCFSLFDLCFLLFPIVFHCSALFLIVRRCLWIVLRCFSIVRVLFRHCCGVDCGLTMD